MSKRHRSGPRSSSSSSSVAVPKPKPKPNQPATPEELALKAWEMEEQNKVNASWDERARRVETRAAVEAGSRHVANYKSAARRYEQWVSRASHKIIVDEPNVPRVYGNVNKVEPWPENGMWPILIEDYMNYYVKNTRGRFGHAHVNSRTARSHMATVLCAGLRKCSFSQDRDGDYAKKNLCKMMAVFKGKKKIPVLQRIKGKMGREYQEKRMTAHGTTPLDNDSILRWCGESKHATLGSNVSEKGGCLVFVSSL